MEADFLTIIANVGFPITLSMYLLVKGKLLVLSDSINDLSKTLSKLKIE